MLEGLSGNTKSTTVQERINVPEDGQSARKREGRYFFTRFVAEVRVLCDLPAPDAAHHPPRRALTCCYLQRSSVATKQKGRAGPMTVRSSRARHLPTPSRDNIPAPWLGRSGPCCRAGNLEDRLAMHLPIWTVSALASPHQRVDAAAPRVGGTGRGIRPPQLPFP